MTDQLLEVLGECVDETDPDTARMLYAAKHSISSWTRLAGERELTALRALQQAELVLESCRTDGPEWMRDAYRGAHSEIRKALGTLSEPKKPKPRTR